MKEIVVISGKGGTGKTSLTAAMALLGGTEIVVADCDVDAADMHLLLQPDFARTEDFHGGQVALIDQDACTACGVCADVCRFDAIPLIDGNYVVDPIACEGCGYCPRVCPVEAITMKDRLSGQWFISRIRTGALMVHARLGIGAENSGKLVAKVKNEAKRLAAAQGKPFILVDGSPGVGCPVVSSLSGADFVVLVTEPTVSGLHDLKRVHELVARFRIRCGCIINKADLNSEVAAKIRTFLADRDIVPLAELPYDEAFTRAMVAGRTITEEPGSAAAPVLRDCWETIKQTA